MISKIQKKEFYLFLTSIYQLEKNKTNKKTYNRETVVTVCTESDSLTTHTHTPTHPLTPGVPKLESGI